MTPRIRAHFDGRVIVPDQPVDLPVNEPLEIAITPCGKNGAVNGAAPSPEVIRERLGKLDSIAGKFSGPVLSDEALRRENVYDDRA
jgi:hypothetical protein